MSGGYESGGYMSGGKRVMHKRKTHHKKRSTRGGGGVFEGEYDDLYGAGFLDDLKDFGDGFMKGLEGVNSVAQQLQPLVQTAAEFGAGKMHRHHIHPMHHPMHHPMRMHHHMHGGLADAFDALDLTDGGYQSGGVTHHLRNYKKKTVVHDRKELNAAIKKMTKAELQRALSKAVRK